MKYPPICFLILFIFCALITLQAQNEEEIHLDFESWNDSIETGFMLDTVVENWTPFFPNEWYYTNETEWRGVSRTTDATHGQYALVLSGYYQYQTTRIYAGKNPDSPGMPINYRPARITGDYKALLLSSNCDSLRGYVEVYLTNFNTNTGKRDTIGEAHLTLEETENEYQDFEAAIEYSTAEALPDTVLFVLAKHRYGFCTDNCYECSHLFLDNIRLQAGTTSQNNPTDTGLEPGFRVFPNPVRNDWLYVENLEPKTKQFSLIDPAGHLLLTREIAGHSTYQLDLKHFNNNLLILTDWKHFSKILSIHH